MAVDYTLDDGRGCGHHRRLRSPPGRRGSGGPSAGWVPSSWWPTAVSPSSTWSPPSGAAGARSPTTPSGRWPRRRTTPSVGSCGGFLARRPIWWRPRAGGARRVPHRPRGAGRASRPRSQRARPRRVPPGAPMPATRPVPVIAFVGALTEQKRPDRFVEVVAALRARGIDFRALAVGDGPLAALARPAAEAAGVELLGARGRRRRGAQGDRHPRLPQPAPWRGHARGAHRGRV